jgi:hypothetical protein
VIDIATGKEVKLDEELGARLGPAHARAVDKLRAMRDEWDPWRDEDPQLVELLPSHDAAGDLGLEARYAATACYACSAGWSSYMIATTVPVDGPLPPRLAPYASAPKAVAAFARAHPDLHIGGWSAAAR